MKNTQPRVIRLTVTLSMVIAFVLAPCGGESEPQTNAETTGASGATGEEGTQAAASPELADATSCANEWNASLPADPAFEQALRTVYTPAKVGIVRYPDPSVPDPAGRLGIANGACVIFVQPPSEDTVGLLMIRATNIRPLDPSADPAFDDFSSLFAQLGENPALYYPGTDGRLANNLFITVNRGRAAPSSVNDVASPPAESVAGEGEACEDITIEPNSDNGIFGITADGISCDEAVELLREWGLDGYPGEGPPGFSCEEVPGEENVMLGLPNRCTNGSQVIGFL